MPEDKIGKEWDEASEAWMDFVRSGKDYYRDGLNNPALFNVLSDAKGMFLLDLACGEGYNTRILAEKGAKVTGVDFSAKMIELARQKEKETGMGIEYFVMNGASLDFPDSSFDIVTCFMALQDIEHFEKAVSETVRVLKPGGRFVFSVPHPCFEIMRKGKEDEKRLDLVQDYFDATRSTIDWNMKRLTKTFRTSTFHRTLTAYFETIAQNGFTIRKFVEPQPTEEALRKYPGLIDATKIAQSVVIEAVKA